MSNLYKITRGLALIIVAMIISQSVLAAPTSCPITAAGHDENLWRSDGQQITGSFQEAGYLSTAQSVYCYYGYGETPTGFLRSNFPVKGPASGTWVKKTPCQIDAKCYKCSTSAAACQFQSAAKSK